MLFFVPVVDMPSLGPLDLFFNLHSRYEQRSDVFFDNSLDEDRTLIDTRARLGFDYDAGDNTRVRVTYQFTNVQIDDSDVNTNTPFFQFSPGTSFRAESRKDLTVAYIEHTNGDSTFTAGRQRVDRGVGKLMGSDDWSGLGRSWNAVRFQHDGWDLFAGRLDLAHTNNGREMLYYGGYGWGNGGVSTLSYKHDPDAADSIYTLDHFWGREMSDNFFLGIQGAVQWGRDGGKKLESWAATVHGMFTLSDKLGAYAQYSTASGGGNATESNTFDDLYPSDHGHYGIMDMQGWRNVNALSIGIGYELNHDMEFGIAYHDFKLNDSSDLWYNARNGTQYGYGANGSDDVGNEIDFTFDWHVQDDLSIHAGMGIFDPGAMIAASGGGTDTQTWFFAGLGWKY